MLSLMREKKKTEVSSLGFGQVRTQRQLLSEDLKSRSS